jgi:acetylornithine aminotransferase
MKCNLVLDEGKFFAHQYHDIKPDIICMAKGMGNGFPIGILIAPHFKASYGLLGTTCHFGLRSKYRCFRYYRKSELNGECCVEAYFMEAIKVIPEIIKVKGRGLC